MPSPRYGHKQVKVLLWIVVDDETGEPSKKIRHLEGTHRVLVEVEIDEEIAAEVLELNQMPGIRTYGSCQGEAPWMPRHVAVSWQDDEALARLLSRFPNIQQTGRNRGTVLLNKEVK